VHGIPKIPVLRARVRGLGRLGSEFTAEKRNGFDGMARWKGRQEPNEKKEWMDGWMDGGIIDLCGKI